MLAKADWSKRLYLPAYQVKSAAAYAGVTPQTVRNWQKETGSGAAISRREAGVSLSYLQLQELAIVSAMRTLNVKLASIRTARDYLASALETEFPFADERVKCDGQDILLQAADELNGSLSVLVVANRGGQYAWSDIIGEKFDEFEYEKGVALKWHLSGSKPVIIDPRISFGSPTIRGVPTWAIRGRELAGEDVGEIADDFGLSVGDVKDALAFEHSLLH
ncbi:MAG: DUF433 domain-containing protein [Thiobacillaceae bacterium]